MVQQKNRSGRTSAVVAPWREPLQNSLAVLAHRKPAELFLTASSQHLFTLRVSVWPAKPCCENNQRLFCVYLPDQALSSTPLCYLFWHPPSSNEMRLASPLAERRQTPPKRARRKGRSVRTFKDRQFLRKINTHYATP